MPVTSPGPVPTDALEFFRAKQIKPSFDFRDVWREEHATIFTVAKTSGFDVIEDINAGIASALKDGTTLAQFKKDLIPLLQKKGWWGVKEVIDPQTGKPRLAQLGSPYRLRTIYQANMRTARAAGQWQRIQRTKRSHPYLLYQLGPSERHRPEHVSWAGTLLPVDHPFWLTHYTPNGYGCKCWIAQVSRSRYDRLVNNGMPDPQAPMLHNPDTGLPTGRRAERLVPVKITAPPTRPRRWLNKRTGEFEQVPVGIDPGWDTNPGAVIRRQAAARRYMNALQSAAPSVAAAATANTTPQLLDDVDAEYRAWVQQIESGDLKTAGGRRTIGGIDPLILQRLEERIGVKPETAGITIEQREITHLLDQARKGDKALTKYQVYNLVRYLAKPRAVIWDGAGKRPALLYVFDDVGDGQFGRLVIRIDFGRGKKINAIRSGGRVPRVNLEQPGMIRLDLGDKL